jgi:hypothetical protein
MSDAANGVELAGAVEPKARLRDAASFSTHGFAEFLVLAHDLHHLSKGIVRHSQVADALAYGNRARNTGPAEKQHEDSSSCVPKVELVYAETAEEEGKQGSCSSVLAFATDAHNAWIEKRCSRYRDECVVIDTAIWAFCE